MPQRGLRGAAPERDVAVDERVFELFACELVEVGFLVFQHPVLLPTAVYPKYGLAGHVLVAQPDELVVGQAELVAKTSSVC